MPMKIKLVESSRGIKTTEDLARAIDRYAAHLPHTKEYEYRRKGEVGLSETNEGERSDVSFITTSAMDRDGEIVEPEGIILDDYRKNQIVLFGHDYNKPTGKCAWIKPKGEGLLAKTVYPELLPNEIPEGFNPNFVWAMVRHEILRGKSIGFLPLEVREPTPEELEKNSTLHTVITKSLLLEYSVVSVPSNPEALVEAIGKGLAMDDVWNFKVLGRIKSKEQKPAPVQAPPAPKQKRKPIDWHKALSEFNLDPERIAKEAVKRHMKRWEV